MSRPQSRSTSYLYLDMHGLVFETSIWLLAGSTRLLSSSKAAPTQRVWSSKARLSFPNLEILLPATKSAWASGVAGRPHAFVTCNQLESSLQSADDRANAVCRRLSSEQTFFIQGLSSKVEVVSARKWLSALFTHRGTIISFPSLRVSHSAYEFVTHRPIVIKKSFAKDFESRHVQKKLYICIHFSCQTAFAIYYLDFTLRIRVITHFCKSCDNIQQTSIWLSLWIMQFFHLICSTNFKCLICIQSFIMQSWWFFSDQEPCLMIIKMIPM